MLKSRGTHLPQVKRVIIYQEMYQKESEACDSKISQVKHSDCQTTAASQLTDCRQGGGRKWWNTPGLQAVKHKGLFIVPSTDYNKLSSVRNTLWGEGTEAYTSADDPCAWGGSHDRMCVFSMAFAGILAFIHTHTDTDTLTHILQAG